MSSNNRQSTFSMIINELIAHSWMSALAVIFGVAIIFIVDSFIPGLNYEKLFHDFHYAHIFFASATATLIGHRFCHDLKRSIFVGIFVPPLFCTLSDIVLPYLGGIMSGAQMELHLCILHNKVLWIGWILSGVAVGAILSKTNKLGVWVACVTSHFLHDLVSTVSSLGYLASFGFFAWKTSLAYTTVLLMVVVLVPCMISDIVLPVLLCANRTDNCSMSHCCTEKDARD